MMRFLLLCLIIAVPALATEENFLRRTGFTSVVGIDTWYGGKPGIGLSITGIMPPDAVGGPGMCDIVVGAYIPPNKTFSHFEFKMRIGQRFWERFSLLLEIGSEEGGGELSLSSGVILNPYGSWIVRPYLNVGVMGRPEGGGNVAPLIVGGILVGTVVDMLSSPL